MISMPGSLVIRTWLKAPTGRAGLKHKYRGLAGLRFVARIGFSISLGLAVALVGPRLGAYQTAEPSPDCPPAQTRINLVFIIDRSGSLANSINPPDGGNRGRGQTYNVELEGVRRALLESSVIPRDGSVSVGAVLFDGEASVALPLTAPIGSDKQAQEVAAKIEALRCPDLDSNIDPCPAGATDFGVAISQADRIAGSSSGARRVFILSTDGEPSDKENDLVNGVSASQLARERARSDGVEAEFDVILIGLPDSELEENKRIVNRIVFPSPPPTDTKLPGAVEVISSTACNEPKEEPSAVSPEEFEEECGCQVRQFADFTRRALRSNIASRSLTVTTAVDPVPSTPALAGDPLSLRQAIEMANSNGGRTMITFHSSLEGKTIQPNVALPPLTAPDITICGCAGECAPSIPDKVTCSQTSLSEEKSCEPTVTIDGQGKLADGILIRSNRDVVRGLRITNFTHAGIVVKPVCPSDNTGFNRIENNNLENNISAGVCILDPPPDQVFAVAHDVGNTISMNDVSGSVTPIDLGGDGPTGNDACDTDEGPNTLLNFPRITGVTPSAGGVTVAGTICDPGCTSQVCPPTKLIGAVVEIFAVTAFGTGSTDDLATGMTSIQGDSDNRTITGVMYLAQGTTDANGSFTISGVPVSPTCGYTATVTDRDQNTSEMMFPCAGLAKANTPDKVIFPKAELDGSPVSATFTIRNDGCDRLVLMSYSIKRIGGNIAKERNRDDSAHFFIGKPSVKADRPVIEFDPLIIEPSQALSITVFFDPAIPRCVRLGERLRAADTLPDTITSMLTINHSGGATDIQLEATVPVELQLISPNCQQPIMPPLVTLTRSGDDELTATYSVFDSNMNVKTVDYVFFKKDGNNGCTEEALKEPEEVVIVDRDLSGPIQRRGLVKGQSFTVIQKFSNAKNHPEVGCVQIEVADGETTVSATSAPVDSSLGAASLQSARGSRGMVLVLPNVRLLSPLRGRAPGVRSNISFRTPTSRNIRRTP